MKAGSVVATFDRLFAGEYRTRLVGGATEPLFVPASGMSPAELRFREDFAASALHEAAHWCLAGARRRRLPDFGYWYERERDAAQQRRFEAAEAPVQALEWIFCTAAGADFRVSVDNFAHDDPGCLRRRVHAAVRERLARGLQGRARRFADALAHESGVVDYLASSHYCAMPS